MVGLNFIELKTMKTWFFFVKQEYILKRARAQANTTEPKID